MPVDKHRNKLFLTGAEFAHNATQSVVLNPMNVVAGLTVLFGLLSQ